MLLLCLWTTTKKINCIAVFHLELAEIRYLAKKFDAKWQIRRVGDIEYLGKNFLMFNDVIINGRPDDFSIA